MKISRNITAILLVFIIGCVFSCKPKDTQIAENTFIHGNKIYKVIDNEVREIGDLSSDTIKKFAALKPKLRDFGSDQLDFVRPGAFTTLTTLYRGNFLYYNLKLYGLNDLRNNYYSGGRLTISFLDEYDFILHSIDVPITDLTNIIGPGNKTAYFLYNGKTEMSIDINSAIMKYDVSAALQKE